MAEKVAKVGVEREEGFLYFVDKDGDISRSVMARGDKKGGKTTVENGAILTDTAKDLLSKAGIMKKFHEERKTK